jgi:hypothetical protein
MQVFRLLSGPYMLSGIIHHPFFFHPPNAAYFLIPRRHMKRAEAITVCSSVAGKAIL